MNKKKDFNYIASVEKAIAAKYGKDTVQDFRSDWQPTREKEYLSQLKALNKKRDLFRGNELIEKKGDVVLKRRNKAKPTERTCPVCKTYSFSTKDDLYMNRFKACFSCYVVFIEDREERWSDGWRPDNDSMEQYLRRSKQCQQS